MTAITTLLRQALLVAVAAVALGACSTDDDAAPAVLPDSVALEVPARVELGQPVRLTSSLGAGSEGLGFNWDLGDGRSSDQPQPSHTYASAGRFDLRLTVRSTSGQSRVLGGEVLVGRFERLKGLNCSQADSAGWCWQRPLPQGNQVLDAYFVDARHGWAVGEAGFILRTRDGGAHWEQVRTGLTTSLREVRFADALNGWATGDQGTLMRSTDGGAHWTRSYPFGIGTEYLNLTVINAQKVALSGWVVQGGRYAPRAWISQDGGTTWLAHEVDLATLRFSADGSVWTQVSEGLAKADAGSQFIQTVLTVAAPQILKASGQGGAGQVWAIAGTLPVHDPLPDGFDDIGYTPIPRPDTAPVLHRSADGGQSWQATAVTLPVGTSGILLPSVRIFEGGLGWAWSASYQLLRTRDGGASWTVMALPDLTAAWRGGWAFADGQTVKLDLRYTPALTVDGGDHWTSLASGFGGVSHGLAEETLRRDRDGGGGLMWRRKFGPPMYQRTTDQGRTWVPVSDAPQTQAYARSLDHVWFADASRGLVVSSWGEPIEQTTDGGLHWQRADAVPLCGIYCPTMLHRPRDGSLWLQRAGRLLRSTGQGLSWVDMPLTSEVSNPHFLSVTSAQMVWTQNTAGAYRSLDGAASWTRVDLPDQAGHLAFANARVGAFITTGGDLWHSADGGQSWRRASTDLRLVFWRGMRIQFVDDSTAWIVGGSDALLRSRDGGASWRAVPLPVAAGWMDLQFADARHGWLVGTGGTVLATDDGGQTWVQQRSGTEQTLLSVWALDAGTVWISGEGGTLLTSSTGGR